MSGSATTKSTGLMAAAALFYAVATVGPAVAQDQMKMGTLDCTVTASAGASKSLYCTFTDLIGLDNEGIAAPNRPDFYNGSIDGVGLNTGSTQQQDVAWVVFAPATLRYYQGGLAGSFVAVSAEEARGLGLGANVLLGGFNGLYVLQPSSDQAQTAANIALGVTAMKLVPR